MSPCPHYRSVSVIKVPLYGRATGRNPPGRVSCKATAGINRFVDFFIFKLNRIILGFRFVWM